MHSLRNDRNRTCSICKGILITQPEFIMAAEPSPRPSINFADQDLARMMAFSDGVFAFALTLLVLDIKVPTSSESELGSQLVAQIPRLVLYVISFLDIGGYWYLHQRLFRHMVRG